MVLEVILGMPPQDLGGQEGRAFYAEGKPSHSGIHDPAVGCSVQEPMPIPFFHIQQDSAKHLADVRGDCGRMTSEPDQNIRQGGVQVGTR